VRLYSFGALIKIDLPLRISARTQVTTGKTLRGYPLNLILARVLQQNVERFELSINGTHLMNTLLEDFLRAS
jgi:hypothetical protein